MRRRFGVAVLLIAFSVVSPATAQPTVAAKYAHRYRVARHRLGAQAVGRNILAHGVRYRVPGGKMQVRDARTVELAVSARRLRAMLAPFNSYLSPTTPHVPPAGIATMRATSAPLASIRACESGGNYGAVSPNGFYRGGYQFDYGTWTTVGGSGDPAAASPAEQDMRAAMLYARRGSAPWPVCGR